MTFFLIALWIAGSTFKWYWLPGAFVLDVLWLSIKLNFITALIRRAVYEARMAESADDDKSGGASA